MKDRIEGIAHHHEHQPQPNREKKEEKDDGQGHPDGNAADRHDAFTHGDDDHSKDFYSNNPALKKAIVEKMKEDS